MISSLLAALLGLGLVWVAVLDPALVESHGWIVGLSAVALLLLGLTALRVDYLKWPAVTDMLVGAILLILFFATAVVSFSLLTFWVLFWSGCVAGIVSLWSVFYRHGPGTAGGGDTLPAQ
jgi:hypothetical protein